MKIRFLLSILFLTIFTTTATAQLEPLKTITLKDGTVLKGRVVSMANGEYTIQTPYLNELVIQESNVESIADHTRPTLTTDVLKNEVENVQGQVMANPELMQEIQETMSDPKVQAIMQDPDFMKAIMSMDPEQIQNNPKTREMLNQPEIRELFQKIESTLNNHQAVQ